MKRIHHQRAMAVPISVDNDLPTVKNIGGEKKSAAEDGGAGNCAAKKRAAQETAPRKNEQRKTLRCE